jgi:hypothetical protein
VTRDFTPPLERITDDIDQLVNGQTTTETIDRITLINNRWKKTKERHSVHFPALLDQLTIAMHGTQMSTDDIFRSAPASKPSARLDAIATWQRIDKQATDWAHILGTRARTPLPDRLRGLIGGAAARGDLQGKLASVVRSWTVEARVVTRLETPAYVPDVPCPNDECERRGTLRIRLEAGIAACVQCGTFWDRDNITILGGYVRWAAEHLKGPRHWLLDDDGFPTECIECLDARREMAERQVARRRAGAQTSRSA